MSRAAPGRRTPAVTVLMPVRDGAAFLPAALRSILDQTMSDLEFVVVDDGSKDATPALLREAAADDRRMRVLRSPGSGIVDALNAGLEAAHGALIARMDADDIAEPDRLALQVAGFAADPALVLAGTAARQITRSGSLRTKVAFAEDDVDLRAALPKTNPFLHPTVMMRADAVRRLGGYRQAFTHAEDYDLWLRLAEVGRMANRPEALMRLRQHEGQVSRVRRLDQRAATALARQAAAGEEAAVAAAAEPSLHRALMAYLSASAPQASDRDVEVMLRALAASGYCDRRTAREVAGRVLGEAPAARRMALHLKLWAGR